MSCLPSLPVRTLKMEGSHVMSLKRATPLSTYKHKDEFIVLAGALELDTTGTVLALKDHIKTHLKSHKDGLMQNLRFMGMFQARQQHTLDQGMGDGEHSGHGGAGPSGLMRSL